jgi:NACHT domain/HEAT repeats
VNLTAEGIRDLAAEVPLMIRQDVSQHLVLIGTGDCYNTPVKQIAGLGVSSLLTLCAATAEHIAPHIPGEYGVFASAFSTFLTHVLAHLTGGQAEAVIAGLERSANHDLEFSVAGAYREALKTLRGEKASKVLSPEDLDLIDYWIALLDENATTAEDASWLFSGEDLIDPARISGDPDVWGDVRRVLSRWAEPRIISPALDVYLADRVPMELQNALEHLVREGLYSRGWIAWQESFFKATYREALHSNGMLAAVMEQIARQSDGLETLSNTLEEMGRNVKRLLERSHDRGSSISEHLASYAASIRTSYQFLRLGSLDADWTDYERRIRLQTVYIPQLVRQALPSRALTRDYLNELRKLGPISEQQQSGFEKRVRAQLLFSEIGTRRLMDVVDDPPNSRLVILGDPGLGKTTLLKRLVLRWADSNTLPLAILIELRRIEPHGTCDFMSFLENGAGLAHHFPKALLEEHLANNKSLMLFDGLDEVSESSREDVVAAIIRFADEHPKARVIVTTRIHGYYPGSAHPERFRDARFLQFTLQDFEDAEIDQFISRWHHEAFGDPSECLDFEQRLRDALSDSPAIRELSSNPLLLTLMAILSRVQVLPKDRTKLYEKCAELLLRNWDLEKFPDTADRRRNRSVKDKLGPDQKMTVLENVAARMQQEPAGLAGNMISQDSLKEVVTNHLKLLRIREPWSVADDLIWMLRERNFMLAYLGDRQYAFIHRTFLEYCVARHIRVLFERTSSFSLEELKAFFVAHWRDDEWREVIRLLSGMIGSEHTAKCVDGLLEQRDFKARQEAVFLAAQCLQEVREIGLVEEQLGKIRPLLLSFAESGDPLTRTRAIRESGRLFRDDPKTFELLERWVRSSDPVTRQAAISQVATSYCEGPAAANIVCELAVSDPDPGVRECALQEVSRLLRSDGESALSLLKIRAIEDIHAQVRRSAVHAAARTWKNDSETLQWLRGVARGTDWVAREVAIRELVHGWSDDPNTRTLLQERATCDDHFLVREAALDELLRVWPRDSSTLEWIAESLVHSRDALNRTNGLTALIKYWRDDPMAKVLLGEIARDDPRSDVREHANGLGARRVDKSLNDVVRELALEDLDDGLRRYALVELARLFREEPETFSRVIEVAKNDRSPDVRIAAIRELNRGWKGVGETVSALICLSTTDADRDVRRAACGALWRNRKRHSDVANLLIQRMHWETGDKDPLVRRFLVQLLGPKLVRNDLSLSLLREQATKDVSAAVRQVAIEVVAKRHTEDVVEFLIDRSKTELASSVRQFALKELARSWHDDSRTLPRVMECLRSDNDVAVVGVALQELIRWWPNGSDTYSLLIENAAASKDSSLVQLALTELATTWSDHAGVLALLKERARDGATRPVRITGLRQLAAKWGEDLSVIALLKDRHQTDVDAEVRAAAEQELAKLQVIPKSREQRY